MLRANHGALVIERVQTATGLDVAGQIIEFLEKHAKVGKTKTKGKG
jgi:ribosomal protein S6--L-glutamate ligase